jgi:hypothetical protein
MVIKHGQEARSLRSAVGVWRYEPRVSAREGPYRQATHLNAPTTNVPSYPLHRRRLVHPNCAGFGAPLSARSIRFLTAIVPAPNSRAALQASHRRPLPHEATGDGHELIDLLFVGVGAESRRQEWTEQTKLAGMLPEYLDPSRTFYTAAGTRAALAGERRVSQPTWLRSGPRMRWCCFVTTPAPGG